MYFRITYLNGSGTTVDPKMPHIFGADTDTGTGTDTESQIKTQVQTQT